MKGVPVCGTAVGPGVQEVSFNPLNWKQICVLTREAVTLWMLEQCGPDSLFTSTCVCSADCQLMQPSGPVLCIHVLILALRLCVIYILLQKCSAMMLLNATCTLPLVHEGMVY